MALSDMVDRAAATPLPTASDTKERETHLDSHHATVRYRAQCACSRDGIDVHTHVVPAHFPRYSGIEMPAGWPSMADANACHKHVMIDKKIYRTVSKQCWDLSQRLEDLDAMQIGLQVLSPMPELLSYWMPLDAARSLLSFLNAHIATLVQESAGRMLGLGAVPLQDIDAAVRMLETLMQEPGFAGVEIGSNINGRPIGDLAFDPFFEAAEALGAAVFVHALHPIGKERLIGPSHLSQALGYPSEIGLAAASALCTNLMVRRPRLRIAFSHGGGTLASLLPRLQRAYEVFPAIAESMPEQSPSRQAQSFFYDALVFDNETLSHLATRFGMSQLMTGTDYPFAFREAHPRSRASVFGTERASASTKPHNDDADAVRDALLFGNAQRFLGFPERSFQ